MTLSRVFCIILLAGMHNSLLANWNGRWESKGADALIGLSTDPQNPDLAKNAFLIIGYSKKFNCSPVVSVLVLNGQKVGTPVKQRTSKSKKNQLIVTADSKVFSDETKLTEYTNGMEMAMRGSQELVNALSNNNTPLSARVGSTVILDFSSASGFEIANRRAKANCN